MSATKRCSTCKETKPVTAFGRDRSRKDGLTVYCKECRKGRYTIRYANRKANGLCRDGCCEPAVEGKTFCQKCLDARNDSYASRKANGLCTANGCDEPAVEGKIRCQKHLDQRFAVHLWRTYHLTVAQYEEMLEAQGFACRICRKTEPGGKGGWHVDHDHDCCPGARSCGRCVRGLLCHNCNVGLGYFRDSPVALVAAAEYLTSFTARAV